MGQAIRWALTGLGVLWIIEVAGFGLAAVAFWWRDRRAELADVIDLHARRRPAGARPRKADLT